MSKFLQKFINATGPVGTYNAEEEKKRQEENESTLDKIFDTAGDIASGISNNAEYVANGISNNYDWVANNISDTYNEYIPQKLKDTVAGLERAMPFGELKHLGINQSPISLLFSGLAGANEVEHAMQQTYAPTAAEYNYNFGKGAVSGASSVAGGIADIFGAEKTGNELNAISKLNKRDREYSGADNILSLDYLTNPSGLTYDVGNMAGSMAALYPSSFLAPATKVTSAAQTLKKLPFLRGLSDDALETMIRGSITSVPESLSEGGNVVRQAKEEGLDNPFLRGWKTAGLNLPALAISNGLEYGLLGGKIFKPLAVEGESIPKRLIKGTYRSVPSTLATSAQQGLEEYVQQGISNAQTDKEWGLLPWNASQDQLDSLLIGALTGAPMSGAASYTRYVTDQGVPKGVENEKAWEAAKIAADDIGRPDLTKYIYSQWALESGRFTAGNANRTNNFAGLKRTDTTANELQSFDSIEDFAHEYAKQTLSHYDLSNVKNGQDFARVLYDNGYFSSDPNEYGANIESIAGEIQDDGLSRYNMHTYNLSVQPGIESQIEGLTPAFKSALPYIGGILDDMGMAEGSAISSAYRTPEHNREVGGVEGSYHTKGDAVDIVLPNGITDEQAQAVRKRFEDTGAFEDVLFHDVGSGYHLHLEGYKGGLGTKGKTNIAEASVQFDNSILDFANDMLNNADGETTEFFKDKTIIDGRGNKLFKATDDNLRALIQRYPGIEDNIYDYVNSRQKQNNEPLTKSIKTTNTVKPSSNENKSTNNNNIQIETPNLDKLREFARQRVKTSRNPEEIAKLQSLFKNNNEDSNFVDDKKAKQYLMKNYANEIANNQQVQQQQNNVVNDNVQKVERTSTANDILQNKVLNPIQLANQTRIEARRNKLIKSGVEFAKNFTLPPQVYGSYKTPKQREEEQQQALEIMQALQRQEEQKRIEQQQNKDFWATILYKKLNQKNIGEQPAVAIGTNVPEVEQTGLMQGMFDDLKDKQKINENVQSLLQQQATQEALYQQQLQQQHVPYKTYQENKRREVEQQYANDIYNDTEVPASVGTQARKTENRGRTKANKDILDKFRTTENPILKQGYIDKLAENISNMFSSGYSAKNNKGSLKKLSDFINAESRRNEFLKQLTEEEQNVLMYLDYTFENTGKAFKDVLQEAENERKKIIDRYKDILRSQMKQGITPRSVAYNRETGEYINSPGSSNNYQWYRDMTANGTRRIGKKELEDNLDYIAVEHLTDGYFDPQYGWQIPGGGDEQFHEMEDTINVLNSIATKAEAYEAERFIPTKNKRGVASNKGNVQQTKQSEKIDLIGLKAVTQGLLNRLSEAKENGELQNPSSVNIKKVEKDINSDNYTKQKKAIDFVGNKLDEALPIEEKQSIKENISKTISNTSETNTIIEQNKNNEQKTEATKEKNVVTVTGDEFGNYDNISELRKKAIQYYKEYLQGTSVRNKKLGIIDIDENGIVNFTGSGKSKMKHVSAKPNKLLLVKHLPELIKNATDITEKPAMSDKHKINNEHFYYLHTKVSINGKSEPVDITLIKRNDKSIQYYNHILPNEESIKKEDTTVHTEPVSSKEALGTPSGVISSTNIISNEDINSNEDVIQLKENDNIEVKENVDGSTSNNTERDSEGNNKNPVGADNESEGSIRGNGEENNKQTPQDGKGQRGIRVQSSSSDTSRTTSDSTVRKESSTNTNGSTRNTNLSGSIRDSYEGSTVFDEGRTEPISKPSEERQLNEGNLLKQDKAISKEKASRLDDIKHDLPILLPEQQGDVLFAEERLIENQKPGVMFTNGTGTGKTYTGLGILKRFVNQGKKNILIVTPSNDINKAWIDAAKKDFDIKITPLENTNDIGKDVVVTTYANMGYNNNLVNREWDLILCDESHRLMSSEQAKVTASLNNLRALTYNHNGLYERFQRLRAEEYKTVDDYAQKIKAGEATEKEEKARQDLIDKLSKEREELFKQWQEIKEEDKPKVVFLSATPFAYVPNVDYAEGYLFNYDEDKEGFRSYNQPSPYEDFFIKHFGYRMRYNKLTKPDADVNTALMEIEFHKFLEDSGALSGRILTTSRDYDRGFILVDSGVGSKIDEGIKFLWDNRKKYDLLLDRVRNKLKGNKTRYILEAIKAKSAVNLVKAYLKGNKKVVIFHDFKKNEASNPFALTKEDFVYVDDEGRSEYSKAAMEQYELFKRERPDLLNLNLKDLTSPINRFIEAFGDKVGIYNGSVDKKTRTNMIKEFNKDNDGLDVILIQRASGKEGISLHDRTGKKQRVLIDLGLPTRPTDAIQCEGRIYRVGVKTNAIFRYLNTGTNTEAYIFSSVISERSSTAENLALGEKARNLKESFIETFEESKDSDSWKKYLPNSKTEGTGGVQRDRQQQLNITPFERAKSYYYANQKKTSKNKAREGIDYYPTPEPIGYKMVEFADIKPGDSVLEPSVGHGAIARFFPEDTKNVAIEPSSELANTIRLRFNKNGRVIESTFENYDVHNKFNEIVMNPPYGTAAKTAMEHLEKAFNHLRDGGRIVALLPAGNSMGKRLDKWLNGVPNAKTKAEREGEKRAVIMKKIELPSVTFERAGTKVVTDIYIIDKYENEADREKALKIKEGTLSFRNIDEINTLFDEIEDIIAPRRILKGDVIQEEEVQNYNDNNSNDNVIENEDDNIIKSEQSINVDDIDFSNEEPIKYVETVYLNKDTKEKINDLKNNYNYYFGYDSNLQTTTGNMRKIVLRMRNRLLMIPEVSNSSAQNLKQNVKKYIEPIIKSLAKDDVDNKGKYNGFINIFKNDKLAAKKNTSPYEINSDKTIDEFADIITSMIEKKKEIEAKKGNSSDSSSGSIENVDDDKFTLDTHTDTRNGELKYRVKVKEKMDFQQLKSLAKQSGGGYSRFAKGFLFSSSEDRQKFVNAVRGITDKEQSSNYSFAEDMYKKLDEYVDIREKADFDNVKIGDYEKEISAIGDRMGTPIYWFTGPKGFRGWHSHGTTYLNVNGNWSHPKVFWHETFHWIARNNPSLFNDMLNDMKKRVTPKQIEDYRKTVWRGDKLSEDKIIEEMMADGFYDVVKRVEYLRNLGKENKSLAKRLISFIRDLMNRFTDFLNNPKAGLTNTQKKSMFKNFMKLSSSIVDNQGNKLFERGKNGEIKINDNRDFYSISKEEEESLIRQYGEDYMSVLFDDDEYNSQFSADNDKSVDSATGIFKGAFKNIKNRFTKNKKDERIKIYSKSAHDTKIDALGNINFIESALVSPERLAEKYVAFKPVLTYADNAMRKQLKNRHYYNKKLNEAFDYLENKDKDIEELNDLMFKGDALSEEYGKGITDFEKRADKIVEETGVKKGTAKAYIAIRGLLNECYELINRARTQIQTKSEIISKSKLEGLKQNKFVNILDEVQSEKDKDDVLVTYEIRPSHIRQDVCNKEQLEALRNNEAIQILEEKEGVTEKDGSTHIYGDDYSTPKGEKINLDNNKLYTVKYREAIPKVNKLEGYVPHFFHDFYVVLQNDDGTTTTVDSGRNVKEAYKKAEQYLKDNENAKLIIHPKRFDFNEVGIDEEYYAEMVGDGAYKKINKRIANEFDMSIDDVEQLLNKKGDNKNKVRRSSKHRFFGNIQHRTGAKGYEDKDLNWVLRHYFNSACRYEALETEFKPKAISYFERIYGRIDTDNKYLSSTARYIKDYINDVNGNPSAWEIKANEILNNNWIWRKYFVSRYGERAALSVFGNVTNKIAILKLGVWNVSSAMLNLMQLLNTIALLTDKNPVKAASEVGKAMKDVFALTEGQTEKRIAKLKPDEIKAMEDTGVLYELGLDSGAGYSKTSFGKWGDRSMILFKAVERLSRCATILAAYRKARNVLNKNHDEAVEYARDINRKANFDYGIQAAPNIFRRGSIISQVLLQFMKYPIKQFELMRDFMPFNGKKDATWQQKATFWGGWIFFAGAFGLPAEDLLWALVGFISEPVFGVSPKQAVRQFLLEASKDASLPERLAIRTLLYGGLSNVGIDISSRVGMADIIPGLGEDYNKDANPIIKAMEKFGGATGGTIAQFYLNATKGDNLGMLRSISPGAYNMYTAAIGESRDGRGRITTKYDDAMSRIIRGMGFKSTNEAIDTELGSLKYYNMNKTSKEKQNAIDDYLDAEERKENLVPYAKKLKELGVKRSTIVKARKDRKKDRRERLKEKDTPEYYQGAEALSW